MTLAAQNIKQRRMLTLIGLLTAPSLLLVVFFLCPLIIMIVYSWLTPGIYGGVEWKLFSLNYGRIFGWADTKYERYDPVYFQIFFNSVRLAGITVFLSLVVCYPVAFWVARLPEKQKNFVIFLLK